MHTNLLFYLLNARITFARKAYRDNTLGKIDSEPNCNQIDIDYTIWGCILWNNKSEYAFGLFAKLNSIILLNNVSFNFTERALR